MVEWKLLKVEETEQQKEPEIEEGPVWRCYSCGATEGFHTTQTWTDYGYEYDVACNECGSEHTFADGEGTPQCDCGRFDWYCHACEKCMCEECWKWFDAAEEPDEYLCGEC